MRKKRKSCRRREGWKGGSKGGNWEGGKEEKDKKYVGGKKTR